MVLAKVTLAKALEYADLNLDYIVLTNADYTYPAEYVPKMIRIFAENPDVGKVCGNRFSGYLDLKGLNSVFYFGNRFISFIYNFRNGIQLVDPLTGLRVVRREILKNWRVRTNVLCVYFVSFLYISSFIIRRGPKQILY